MQGNKNVTWSLLEHMLGHEGQKPLSIEVRIVNRNRVLKRYFEFVHKNGPIENSAMFYIQSQAITK